MYKLIPLGFLFVILTASCGQKNMSDANLHAVKDSIVQLTNNTAKNITAKGPVGWLDEFENSPDFYMASDGNLEFNGYSHAKKSIKELLVMRFSNIYLHFSDVEVTVLSPEYGSIGASFSEVLNSNSTKTIVIEGYFTATAHHTSSGWKYINMHWSTKK